MKATAVKGKQTSYKISKLEDTTKLLIQRYMGS
jgi:hypothetical protein